MVCSMGAIFKSNREQDGHEDMQVWTGPVAEKIPVMPLQEDILGASFLTGNLLQ